MIASKSGSSPRKRVQSSIARSAAVPVSGLGKTLESLVKVNQRNPEASLRKIRSQVADLNLLIADYQNWLEEQEDEDILLLAM